MKNLLKIGFISILASAALVSCGSPKYNSELEKILAEASKMTDQELYEKAKTENAVKVYSTTSLLKDALASFKTKYPEIKDITESDFDEAPMFTKLTTEIGKVKDGADMTLCQNAYRMKNELIDEKLTVNYFPEALKSSVGAAYQNPTALLFVAKLLFVNKTNDALSVKNVWELTEAKHKNNIYFKTPTTEPVGMNFLIMLTSPEWQQKLGDAYQAQYGKVWADASGKYKNVSYEFLDKFLANCNYEYSADGGICSGISGDDASGKVGLFVFSKLRSNANARKNLEICAYGKNGESIKGFSGYMYPTYIQVCKDTDSPYTCALLTNHLMSQEGGAAWNNENNMGTYLSNTAIPKVADKYGLDRDVNFFTERCVVEDGTYLAANYAEVYEYIATRI